MPNKSVEPNKNRYYYFFITFLCAGIILYNLFNLQIVKGSQYYFDSKNLLSTFTVLRANRGLIYDRNGIKLVDNETKYNLSIIKSDKNSERFKTTVANLSKIFNENVEEKYDKEFEKTKNLKNIDELKIYTNLDYNPYIFQIEANPKNFPLLNVQTVTLRKYLYPELTSHILGYTGEITAEDYQTGNYAYGDVIGKSGVELGYDQILRGKNGIERLDLYNSDSQRINSLVQQKEDGKDIYLTIDIGYQQRLYTTIKDAFKKGSLQDAKSAAAVIQDVKTGEILAMGSYPTFDSNLFTKGISQEEYDAYLNDPGKPLTNKATQFSQPPGSILKTMIDAAALQNGAIDKNTIFYTGGTFDYSGTIFRDFANRNYGDLNVVGGICKSSNIFHMKTALKLDEITNGQADAKFYELFDKMNLNKKSNLNIGPESIGYFPTKKDKEQKGQKWFPGFLLNSSIGQGEVKMTPLEASTLAATMAGKGEFKKQKIILEKDSKPEVIDLGVKKEHFDTINEGMKCAAAGDNGLTGYDIKKYPEVSVKTGTAETGQISSDGQPVIHAWEISFTPSDNPEIAMSVFIENGRFGYLSGYISREFYKIWGSELKKK